MRFISALTVLLCFVQGAEALQEASVQDYSDIADILKKANTAEDGINSANAALEKAKGDEDLELILRTKISRLTKESKDAHEQAMWRTMRAFDIIPFADNVPILDEGVSVLRSQENGKPIRWLPIFAETIELPLYNEEGTYIKMRDPNPNVVGNTASDGISRILHGAFSSPEMLASVIIHEQRHFIQNITAGKGDKKTTAELEVEAYEYEWRLMKVLGFSGESKRAQEDRLTEILNGTKGVKGQKDIKGKRTLAKEERAVADKDWSGWPFPELSIKSHSKVEIDGLIQQAKAQIAIAQRDHDDRLKKTLGAVAVRSCASPGTVLQEDLDGLPKPHDWNYLRTSGYPSERDDCVAVVYKSLIRGADAEEIKNESLPKLRPVMPTLIAPGTSITPTVTPHFSSIFPQLKDFATAKCLGLNQPRPISRLYRRYWLSITESDNNLAKNLSAGMDNCSRHLFNKIIEKTRAAQGKFELTDEWVDGVVAANTPEQETVPGYTPPQAVPPAGGGRRCEDYGVINCPKGLRR